MLTPNGRNWTSRLRKTNMSSLLLSSSHIWVTHFSLAFHLSIGQNGSRGWGKGWRTGCLCSREWLGLREVSVSRALSEGVYFLCTSVSGVLWPQPDCGWVAAGTAQLCACVIPHSWESRKDGAGCYPQSECSQQPMGERLCKLSNLNTAQDQSAGIEISLGHQQGTSSSERVSDQLPYDS